MRLEIRKCLQDVLLAAQDIEDFLSGLDYAQYASSSMIQAAVERKIEIIGEALNRMARLDKVFVSELYQYKRIIGFRNVIAHGYDIVDLELVWDAVRNHLPPLKIQVEQLLRD